jgi:sulfide:quinone oxidoreductase
MAAFTDNRFTRRTFLFGAALTGAGFLGGAAYLGNHRQSRAKGRIVVVGGGAAGIDIAARLQRRLAEPDITIIDPAPRHFYQAGFTLLASGVFAPEELHRPQESLIPPGVRFVQDSVVEIEPERNRLKTNSRGVIEYDYMVLTPGLEMDFSGIEGVSPERLGEGNVHCIYLFEGAQKCWQAIQKLAQTGGRAYFTDTWTKVKCGGAPKKINMMAEHYCRLRGARERVEFRFYTATDHLYDIQPFRKRLEEIYAERGIPVTMNHRVKSVDIEARRVTFENRAAQGSNGGERVTVEFDFLHIVPPMRAPRFVRESALAYDESTGKPSDWTPADPATLVHKRFKNVFVAGDVANLPTSKTAAAVRMQAPVAAANLIAAMEGRGPDAAYDGYAACPYVTEYGKVLMAEFDYSKKPRPTLPLLDPGKEHRAGWVLKRYILKPFYFELMLRGLA